MRVLSLVELLSIYEEFTILELLYESSSPPLLNLSSFMCDVVMFTSNNFESNNLIIYNFT